MIDGGDWARFRVESKNNIVTVRSDCPQVLMIFFARNISH